jgi:hypothetical protein
MEAAFFGVIYDAGVSEKPARILSLLIAEFPYVLCSVMGAELKKNAQNMFVTDDSVYHSVRELLLDDIIAIPHDYIEAVSGETDEAVIGRMLVGMMGDLVASYPAAVAPLSPLMQRLLGSGFAVPLYCCNGALVAAMPDGSSGIFVDADDDAFPQTDRFSRLEQFLVSCGVQFGTPGTLLSRVTFSFQNADGATFVVGPSVPLTDLDDVGGMSKLCDGLVLENAISSDVVDVVRRLASHENDVVRVHSPDTDWKAIGWEFVQSPYGHASAVVAIEHFDVRGTTVIVNPTCMSPIVELLQEVNFLRLSPAQLLLQLYPHIVTRYLSRVVPPTIDIVSFSWPAISKYFARFATVTVRPKSLVVDLVLNDPYNTVDILSRFLSRHGSYETVRAQSPPIYDGTCAVCLTSNVPLSVMLQYDCRHVFCSDCAQSVLAMTRSNACPLCRHVTSFLREPMRGDDDLIETVDFSDAIEQMRKVAGSVILSDVPEILAAFPGVATSSPRDFAGQTVLFCGRPRLLERALQMRNTFRAGELKVKRFEIKDGFDEFSRTFFCSVVSDQMLMFWTQRHHTKNMKEVQAWIDRFSSMSDLRAWQGPGFFVHPRVLYNPMNHMMQLGGNGYVSVAKMTELFEAIDSYTEACPDSDMDLDDDLSL